MHGDTQYVINKPAKHSTGAMIVTTQDSIPI